MSDPRTESTSDTATESVIKSVAADKLRRTNAGSAVPKPLATPWRPLNRPAIGTAVVLAALVPLALMYTGQRYVVSLLITAAVYSAVSQCWNLVIGVSGIFSLGQLVPFAVGGYASGLLAIHTGASPLLTIAVGAVVSGAASAVLGVAVLRASGVYVALLTLAVVQLAQYYLGTGPTLFGGYLGLQVPPLRFASGPDGVLWASYAALVLAFITGLIVRQVTRSPLGVAAVALRDAQVYATSRGIDPLRSRLLIYSLSGLLTGAAGAFLAHYQATVSPQILSFSLMTNFLTMIVVGGWATIWGPSIGAVVFVLVDSYLLRDLQAGGHQIVIGLLLVVAVVAAPGGLSQVLGPRLRTLLLSLFPLDEQDQQTPDTDAGPDTEHVAEEDTEDKGLGERDLEGSKPRALPESQ